MSPKLDNKVRLTIALLGSSVLTALACVQGFKQGGPCGTPVYADCYNGCVAVSCTTANSTCTGAPTSYYCTNEIYTATCTRLQLTKREGHNEFGIYYCFCVGGSPIGTIPAPGCSRVTTEITGCP